MTGKLNTKPCRKSLNKLCASSRDKQIYQKLVVESEKRETEMYYRDAIGSAYCTIYNTHHLAEGDCLWRGSLVMEISYMRMRGWQSFE